MEKGKRKLVTMQWGLIPHWSKDEKIANKLINVRSETLIEKPFAMAGLYENWTNPEGKVITTCTIVTTEANEFMKPLHHRMPVIVRPEDYDLWLNPLETDFPKLQKVFSPIDSESMKAFEVSIQVN